MSRPYQPIDCNFYDELEARATLGRQCEIVYRDPEEGTEYKTAGIIRNLYVRNKIEYMLLDNGLEIRLDHLISVDGLQPDRYC